MKSNNIVGTYDLVSWENRHESGTITYPLGPDACAEVDNVIWGLQRMKPKDDLAKEEIRKLIGYLDNNRERIHYRGDRIGGYPIGSGGIESANKFISHTRMK